MWPCMLGQGHQNLISSLLCLNYISMKIYVMYVYFTEWQEISHPGLCWRGKEENSSLLHWGFRQKRSTTTPYCIGTIKKNTKINNLKYYSVWRGNNYQGFCLQNFLMCLDDELVNSWTVTFFFFLVCKRLNGDVLERDLLLRLLLLI